jgi:hypothetical protein
MDLIKEGWKITEIDDMDINYFLSLISEKEEAKKDNIEDFYKRI